MAATNGIGLSGALPIPLKVVDSTQVGPTLGAQAIRRMRLAPSSPGAVLLRKSIPLQAYQMSADSVVGQMQYRGQLIDGTISSAEQRKNLSACAF